MTAEDKLEIYEDAKAMKRKFDALEKLEPLDKYCSAILVFFEMHGDKEFGFNQLYRELNKIIKITRVDFKRPTLSTHLKHLFDKNILEVREETESNLKIKPRKYKLRDFWANILRSRKYKDYTEIANEFKNKKIELLTLNFIEKSIDLCIESFKEGIYSQDPLLLLQVMRFTGVINYLVESHGKIVIEKKETEKVLKLLEDINIYLKQKIRERYDTKYSDSTSNKIGVNEKGVKQ